MTEYTYQQLKSKYGDFSMPMVDVRVNDKSFHQNKGHMLIGEVEAEITCGFEASAASYCIYNCVDSDTGEYQIKELKPYIMLGSSVEVQMGYQGNLTEIFRGIVTQVQFIGEEGEAPCVEVSAMDVKGIMMAGSYARQMRTANYGQAVREIFDKAPYQSLISQGVIQSLSISDTQDYAGGQKGESAETIEMVSESDYEFVVKAAKKLNYEFFTRKGTLYFRKAKECRGILIELGPKQGMLGSRVSYDISGIVKTVEARGMDSKRGEAVTAKRKFNHKLSLGNKAKSFISQTQKVYIDASIHTSEQAGDRADSLLEQMAYRYGVLEGSCVGMPELEPGNFVKVTGLGTPADNRFYLTKVRHVLTAEDGYRTYITAQAPGIEEG